ncbi:MAG: zinc-binding alcohol dehydrogenase family protein [Myxococcales bacterium]|nr:zinc-binding alcohol dehydrogenase family protein [Myxococcales bacterium]
MHEGPGRPTEPMPHDAEAWFLHAGSGSDFGRLAELRREPYQLPDLAHDELLCEPLYGSWEGNMNHALLRKPIDVCKHRGEERVVVGNSAVLRVLETGSSVTDYRPGQLAMLFCAAVVDRWGYPELALAYDAPGTIGALSTRMILRRHELVPLPEPTRHSLPQWAAFSARYVTAWSNWEQAYGTFRLLVGADELPSPHVWGWGGGTTLAELDLARRHGCETVMLSANERRLSLIAQTGVTALDRTPYRALCYDERKFVTDKAFRKQYLEAEAAFLREVDRRTDGMGVQIFIDYIGTPVLRATLKALSRQGVITTAGWQQGMVSSHLRAIECIGRHQHVHTHYARHRQGVAAVAYAEREGWVPQLDDRIYEFDEIPQLAQDFAQGRVGFFPVFRVNPE